MGDNGNSSGGLVAFFQRVWAGVVGVFGVVSAILGYIELAEGNLGLLPLVLLGVGVAGLFLSCFYYAFIWKPELGDGQSAGSLIITPPGSNQPVLSQGKKEKHRKRIRWIARFGLLIVPLLVWGGYKVYQYQVNLPPTDFKILVANFEGSDAKNHRVTQEIFRNLEREMEPYGDEVKVKRLNKSLGSIKEAKNAGKSQKAAIVIWGDYQVMDDIVPISVNFEILKDTTNFPKLGESVKGKTQPAQLSELTSFNLQTNLSQEMTYLSLFTLGMYRYIDDDLQQAIQYYKQALSVSQETNIPIASLGKEVVYSYLGICSYLLELYDEARSFYNQAITINPRCDIVWNEYGLTLLKLGKHQEAIASFNKALAINPDDDLAWNNLGLASLILGKHKKALTYFNEALAINPDDNHNWNYRGFTLEKLGKYKEAIESYDKALAINPDYDIAWNNRGAALKELGKYEEAISSYNKAIAINPDYNFAWLSHGVILDELGRYEEAIASFDKAIVINPNLYQAWYNKATSYALQNNISSAIENLEQAFSLNPQLREYIKTDTDFDAIRNEQRFKDLIENQ